MDSRGDRKIKWRVFLTGITLFLILELGAGLGMSRISEQHEEELAAIYPQYEEEFADSFSYYEKKWMCLTAAAGAVNITIFVVLLAADRVNRKREEREETLCRRENMERLSEVLDDFGKGRYEVQRGMFRLDPEVKSEEFPGRTEREELFWRQMEERLIELSHFWREQKERFEEEENGTKTLITDISHQLKTPLSSLKMCYELSLEEGLSAAERREFVEREQREIERLESLLAELVKLSRLEHHMIQIEPKPASLQKIVAEAVSQVLARADERKIELCASGVGNVPVNVDEKWTAEALVNVLDNAVKYSYENGKVQLRVSELPHLVFIEIEDDGIGIAQEELHKIFQRFYRGREAERYTDDGAGVGLCLARRILEEQGGTITAKRKQQGTIFRITLPKLTKLL